MTIINPNITEADVVAVNAVLAGKASADQQIRAMQWIGAEACLMFNPSYQPGELPLATAHAEGRRYVGILIMKMKDPETLKTARANSKRGTTR